MLPGVPIQTEEQPAWWEERQHQGQKQLTRELFIAECAFNTAFLGLDTALSGQVTAEHAEIDALPGDHGLHDIQGTFQGIDPQVRCQGFDMAQDFVRLGTGRFWRRHTPRTLPFLSVHRDEIPSSDFLRRAHLKLKVSGTEVRRIRCSIHSSAYCQDPTGLTDRVFKRTLELLGMLPRRRLMGSV